MEEHTNLFQSIPITSIDDINEENSDNFIFISDIEENTVYDHEHLKTDQDAILEKHYGGVIDATLNSDDLLNDQDHAIDEEILCTTTEVVGNMSQFSSIAESDDEEWNSMIDFAGSAKKEEVVLVVPKEESVPIDEAAVSSEKEDVVESLIAETVPECSNAPEPIAEDYQQPEVNVEEKENAETKSPEDEPANIERENEKGETDAIAESSVVMKEEELIINDINEDVEDQEEPMDFMAGFDDDFDMDFYHYDIVAQPNNEVTVADEVLHDIGDVGDTAEVSFNIFFAFHFSQNF
jgi:hypothetical protein